MEDHTAFTYDKRGNLIQEQYGKNKKVTSIGTYTYDETNKMVKGVNAMPKAAPISITDWAPWWSRPG